MRMKFVLDFLFGYEISGLNVQLFLNVTFRPGFEKNTPPSTLLIVF